MVCSQSAQKTLIYVPKYEDYWDKNFPKIFKSNDAWKVLVNVGEGWSTIWNFCNFGSMISPWILNFCALLYDLQEIKLFHPKSKSNLVNNTSSNTVQTVPELWNFWPIIQHGNFILLATHVIARSCPIVVRPNQKEREEYVSEWCPNVVRCHSYLYNYLWVKWHIYRASWAYIKLRLT